MKKRKPKQSPCRRLWGLGLILGLFLLILSGCSTAPKAEYKVVTTIYPIGDWVDQIAPVLWPERQGAQGQADQTRAIMLQGLVLQDTGADLHSYQPTASDMAAIAACDLFIYVGGESDDWVEEALKNKTNPRRLELNLIEVLGDAALLEEHKEGMQEDAEEDAHEEADHEAEKDEHIWLSLKNARICCEAIRDALKQINGDWSETLDKNCAAYTEKLLALQKEYEAAASNAATRTLLFGDRFPFRYLVEELNLDYYAAFSGCSTESEASFETIVFLAEKLDELGLKVILQTENGNQRLAQTIVETSANPNRKILQLNSMQSVSGTLGDPSAFSYLKVMEENLAVLREALK